MWSSSGWKRGRRGTAPLVMLVGCVLIASTASADRELDTWTVQELQDGASFESSDGVLTFSDFNFSAIGFDDSAFDEYLVQWREQSLLLILGLGEPFGPGTLEMTYTVSTTRPFAIVGASIPFLAVRDAEGPDPLVEASWGAWNGATLSDATRGFGNPPGVSTGFDPVTSLMIEQSLSLSGGGGVAMLANLYPTVPLTVPEPTSGMLLGMGVGVVLFATRRRS